MDLTTRIFTYLSIAVTLASLALVAINWTEKLLLIWMPRGEWPRFWVFYKKLTASFEYISISRSKWGRSDVWPYISKGKPAPPEGERTERKTL